MEKNPNRDMRYLIEETCNNMYRGNGIRAQELCFCIFLGKDTVSSIEPPLKEAWRQQVGYSEYFVSLSVEENFYVEDILEALQTALMDQPITRLRMEFVALMEDPIFSQEGLSEELAELNEYLREIALDNGIEIRAKIIGVFDAKKPARRGYDYSAVFQVISGAYPSFFKEVYHVEKGLMESDFSRVCSCIVNEMLIDLKNLYDIPTISNQDSADYKWSSLWVEERQVAGSILCETLLQSYEDAIGKEESLANVNVDVLFSTMIEKQIFREDAKDIFDKGKLYLPRNEMGDLLEDGAVYFIEQNCLKEKDEINSLMILKRLLGRYPQENGTALRDTFYSIGKGLKMDIKKSDALIYGRNFASEEEYLKEIFKKVSLRATLQSLEEILDLLEENLGIPEHILREEEERLQTEYSILKGLRKGIYNLDVGQAGTALNIRPVERFQDTEEILKGIETQQLVRAASSYLRTNGKDILSSWKSDVDATMAKKVAVGIGNGAEFTNWKCCVLNPSLDLSIPGLEIKENSMVRADSMRMIFGKKWNSYHTLTKYDAQK